MTFSKRVLFFAIGFLLLGTDRAAAAFAVELSPAYFSDQSVSTSEIAQTYLYSQFAGYISVDSKKRLFVGWDYLLVNHTVAGSTNTVFATTDMGPAVMYMPSSKRPIVLGAAFHIQSQAAFQSTSTVAWNGTGYVVSVAYAPDFNSKLNIGVALNYWSASYTRETTASGTTSINYGRNMLIPSLKIIWHP